MRNWIIPTLVAAGIFLASCDDTEPDLAEPSPTLAPDSTATSTGANPSPVSVASQRFATGYNRPVFIANAADGSNRLFVVEKSGIIRILKEGQQLATPFLDISAIVRSSSNEQGLLGLAFHPEYEKNGRFFVAYTARSGENAIAEYRTIPPGSDTANPDSGNLLIAVSDPYPNHNGGMLAFGPDGYLYMSMGDGGSAGDPNGNGQNINAMLGKILRIDINGGGDYTIPPGNPFAAHPTARKEIWAYGLRNPWRFSFDRKTGDLWIADVGQGKWEEVDFQAAGAEGGLNYGWNIMEGDHCYQPAAGCAETGLTKPVFEYDHGRGCSITGGYVYRGTAIPSLTGRYLFTDYCSATLWALSRGADGKITSSELGKLPGGVTTFGEDEAGELYFAVDSEGTIYRLIAK